MTLSAAIACTRFGLGARVGDISEIQSDPPKWLRRQLSAKAAHSFPDDSLLSAAETLSGYAALNRQRQTLKKSGEDIDAITKKRRKYLQTAAKADLYARLNYGATTEAPFHERLVRFWSNHFSISTTKPQLRLIAGAYEREAIRPHILGNFADLAAQAIFHPAMLIYLDNAQSIGPNSKIGKRREKGLNENLAREIMELHTLTPRAQYSQADVTEFARALTGWTIGRNQKQADTFGKTSFVSNRHEPGARKILGVSYSADEREQAKRILRNFCTHPATAQNIAYKLAKHFIADIPPPTLVKTLKARFIETGGNLTALYHTLIDAEEMWVAPAQKAKTPDELLTSAARLIGLEASLAERPNAVFKSLAQRPFSAPTPQGWPDDGQSWIGPDSLSKRIEWANRVGKKNADLDAVMLIQEGVGARLSQESLQAISRAESASDALTLALLCPEFQRR